MMVAVLQTRASAEHSIHREAEEEHLSDLGGCMELGRMDILDCIDSFINDAQLPNSESVYIHIKNYIYVCIYIHMFVHTLRV